MASKVALVAPTGVGGYNGRNGVNYVADASGIVQFNQNDVLDALGAGWQYPQIAGTTPVKNNLTATTDPGVSNDNTQDYGAGSLWANTTKSRAWLCISAATGAAVWVNIAVDSTLTPATDNISAAGTTQAGATALTSAINRIGTAAANSGVALPVSKDGLDVIVVNNGANPLNVYPFNASGDTIDGLGANAAVVLMPNSTVLFVCTAAGAWTTEGLSTGYSGSLQTLSYADALSANSGGVQAGATAITTLISRFTTVGGAGYSSVLPASAPGLQITVINDGANAMNVFPAGSDAINNLAASAALSLAVGAVVTFNCTVAGKWRCVPPLPSTQYTTISQASGVIPAANFAGADKVTLQQSGATALTTPTAAAILAAIPGGVVGMTYRLRIKNTNGGTLTLTADGSVTLTGTATIATTAWREYDVKILTSTTASMQDIGSGAA